MDLRQPSHCVQEAAVKHGVEVAGLQSAEHLAAVEADRRSPPVWGQRVSHLAHIEERRLAKAYPRYAW